MCVGNSGVFVVEVMYEPPESRGICVECNGSQGVFPDGILLCEDVVSDFLIESLKVVDDVWCWELFAEMITCFEFVADFSGETGAVLLDSPGWDVLFAVVYDYGREMFCGCVDVCEVVDVEICK